MNKRRQERWMLVAAVLMYSAIMLGLGLFSYWANERHIVYALDDAYIHMAMARNTIQYATFGITPYEFSSSSSSPLWTVLLAGLYYASGTSEWLPLLLNYIFGAASIFVIWSFGLTAGVKGLRLALLLVASILLTPMIPVAFTGMEHLMHLCTVMLVIHCLWRLLNHNGSIGLHMLWPLGVSTAFAVAARYESLFLVAAAGIALAAKRRWAVIVVCGLCALIPVCVVGAVALANGQHFLPNTLLLKGNIPAPYNMSGIIKLLGGDLPKRLIGNPHLYILTICLVGLFWWKQRNSDRLDATNLLLIVVVAATALHLQFARTNWFYRYEAYLVTLALIVLSIQFRPSNGDRGFLAFRLQSWTTMVSFSVVLFLLLLPLVQRAAAAHFTTVQATRNIYQQQYQMGRFLHRFYAGEPVAANDVGAINYLARLQSLDLWGLGSQEILRHKRKGSYSTAVIRELARARGVRVAVVYTSWFKGQISLPKEWTVVGTWTIPNNVVCGDDTVAFLATESSEVRKLLTHLRAFSAELPRGVVWKESITGEVNERLRDPG